MFVKGAIIQSVTTIFGEIGGQFEIDLLKFDEDKHRGILRVKSKFAVKTRSALTFTEQIQGFPAILQLNQCSNQLSSFLDIYY